MPRFSIYTDPKGLSIFIHRFWDAITLIEEKSEAVSFLRDLLTPTEVRMVAKRLQIADMLARGYKYQDIQNYVRVTKQTIASVNNKLNFGEEGLIGILRKLEKIDQAKQDRLEGKKSLFAQPQGIGKASLSLATLALTKTVRHYKKVNSVKKGE